jgi:hypothetical protein
LVAQLSFKFDLKLNVTDQREIRGRQASDSEEKGVEGS